MNDIFDQSSARESSASAVVTGGDDIDADRSCAERGVFSVPAAGAGRLYVEHWLFALAVCASLAAGINAWLIVFG
jgi:hypothetical protein